jgi:MarR family transcriptional regulator, transcriptional regulator for hemolysin
MRPIRPPVGLHLTRTSRVVSRAFDDALAQAGGSLPVWLLLVSLKANPRASQREIAESMGVTEATLSHHLNSLDAEGLVTRRRLPSNRRVHLLELTEAGEATFTRLREAAVGFDRRLRRGVTDEEIGQLQELLERLAANAGSELEPTPPWPDLVDSRRT